MRLSTSNSDHSGPDYPWVKMWLLGLTLIVILCISLEIFWRSKGHFPSIVDDKDLWAYYRSNIYENGDKTIVLLGSSRMQLDFSTFAFKKLLPDYSIIQLAINGKSGPVATLFDLTKDDKFKGVIICEVEPRVLMQNRWNNQKDYIDYFYKIWSLNKKINRILNTFLQNNLIIINPTVKFTRIIREALKLKLPEPYYVTTHYDRSESADYSKIEIVSHRKERVKLEKESYLRGLPIIKPEEWLRQISEIEPIIERFQKRGGKVIYAVFPISGELLDIEEKYYPKYQYWDKFAEATSAVTIHFRDIPELSIFECPDTSHLDYHDAERFTIALTRELAKRNIFNNNIDLKQF